ncbi:MAG: PAS domain S-box protein [Burkholderiales bacterium]|nr:PAS domain S-box protein [Burkholderiales bacterium]
MTLDMSPAMTRELLLALLDEVPARVVLFDAEQRYLYANRATLEFLHLAPDQLIGRTVAEVRGAEMAARNVPVFQQVLAGTPSVWEGWTEYPGVGRRYTEERLQRFGDRHVLGYARDLTEFKLQATEAQRAETLKAAIVDNALAALVTTDAKGHVVAFNPAAEAMFRCTRSEAVGRSVAEVMIPPRLRPAHQAGMERMAIGGPPRVMGKRLEMQAQRADGSEFPSEMVLWRTDAEGAVFYTASINDLSERRRAEETIERQREALRQSEKLTAMGSLLAGVAHELNNPLAIVMGRASLLQEKCADTELALDATRIHEAAERCGRIVRTFLNMARSKASERAPVQMNELVRAATELLSYGLRSHGIALELVLEGQLPSVHADADQLGQILLNLIVNAQQALAQAPAPRRLRIVSGVEQRRAEREPRVWVRVIDNGPGVPAALRDTVFEPFFTTKPESLGTGLGLAVSRSLAREHGGELRIEDGPEGGACFRLSLPISGEAQPEPLPTAPAPLEEGPRTRLLVVDDEPEIADLMRAFLEGAGHEVATAESGAVALALLQEARFDAVVSDLRMPDLDGAGLHRALRQSHPELAKRLLFVTGDTLSPGARSFLEETGCACLDKPFTKADLLTAVQGLLADRND